MTAKKPEILAPVGNWEMCQAAVHNGADAVYIGMPHFNARGRTRDFTTEELKQMIDFCHLYGVRVLLACNVLVFEKELEEIEVILREILPLRPDALIVQDIGLVRLIKKLAPDQVVHASTQMTVTNSEAIEITADLDMKRYVLGREVSIKEMEKIRSETTKELEVFVHGALCVAYSGQCLTSESHGGRSANRGQCAQSCRLDYTLIVDGKEKDLGAKRHLVSPQDLCGIEDVGRLVEVGIDSFKIEGRLKSPEYVAATVRNYNEVTDAALRKELPGDLKPRLHELGLTFARGQFNGWFDGVNHQRLVDARYSRPTGVFLGEIRSIENDTIEIITQHSLDVGDGVVFHDFDKHQEAGGIVFSVKAGSHGTLRIWMGREFDTKKLSRGMQVFHNSSSKIDKELKQSFVNKESFKRIPLKGTLAGEIGTPLALTLKDDHDHVVTLLSTSALAPAKNAPLSAQSALDELGALSGTPFILTGLEFAVKGAGFIHNKELKELRRRAIEALSTLRINKGALTFNDSTIITDWKSDEYRAVEAKGAFNTPSLNVLIREDSQLAALEGARLDTVYLDFEFNKDYEHALNEVRRMGFRCGIATTRILKTGELGHLKYIERLKPDAVLVRNLGALQYFRGKNIPLVGDFSLNVSNGLSATWFLSKGLSRLCPSYDLNQWQLMDLLSSVSPSLFEVTVHQYMPAFHMEHCVFAAFLSNGSSYRDCGRPCEKHRVELKDKDGTIHPLKADAECRNTMFQGKPQAAARLLPDLLSRGVKNFRIEALFEDTKTLRAKIDAYTAVLLDGKDPQHVFTALGIVERYGVTEGQLFNARTYEDKKKESLSVLQ